MDFGMLRLGVLLVDISQVRFAASFVGGKALSMKVPSHDVWTGGLEPAEIVEESPSTIAGFKNLSIKQCQTSIAKQPMEHQKLNLSTT